MEDKVEIPDPLEDTYAIQEMGEDKYHEEDLNIISEESDDEIEEGDDMTIEDDTDEEDVIVDKPIKMKIIKKFHQQPGRVLFEKSHH